MPVLDRRWRRVELVPMDPYCDDITIALYCADEEGGPVGLVHTYSARPGAAERVAFVAEAMRVLGGPEAAGSGDARLVGFPCRTWHALAARRAFLEAAKLDPSEPLTEPQRRTSILHPVRLHRGHLVSSPLAMRQRARRQ